MNYIPFRVFYPKVDRTFPAPSDDQKEFASFLTFAGKRVETTEADRQGFCDWIFAGMGNSPHTEDAFSWFRNDRSMSVGDVVFLPESNEWFICDNCGWLVVTEREATLWLNHPRKYGCCMFELSEWKRTF